MALASHATASRSPGSGPRRSRSRPTCRQGLPGLSLHRPGRHRRCVESAIGSARRSSTPARAGPTGGSRSRCCPPTCARSGRASTSRSRWPCWPAATGSAGRRPCATVAWIAELGLDGRLRPVARRAAVGRGRPSGRASRAWWSSPGNGAEAALVPGIDVRVARDLARDHRLAARRGRRRRPVPRRPASPIPPRAPDLADVAGQALAKRAVEVAAAGAHHVYLVGRARRRQDDARRAAARACCRALDDDQALEVTAVHSVAGAARRACAA